jgi:ISXO2-like transposase domain/Transposase zinc-ribbon domain
MSGSEGRFPKSLIEFQERFASEGVCAEYRLARRWPEGFVCPGCGDGRAWLLKTRAFTYQCAACGRQTSVTAGMIIHASKLPLTTWFWAAYLMATHSNGISALQLQSQLGLGSYRTAWMLCAKLRRVMVNPEREPLCGVVEADETIILFRTKDDPVVLPAARSRVGKMLVAGAVEVDGGTLRRARLKVIEGFGKQEIHAFVLATVAPQTKLVTDDWPSYNDIPEIKHKGDHRRSDGSAHCPALDPSAVLKPQALRPRRLPWTAEDQPPVLPGRVRVPLQSNAAPGMQHSIRCSASVPVPPQRPTTY